MKKIVLLSVTLVFAFLFSTCDKKVVRAIPAVSPCDFDLSNSISKTNANSTTLNERKVLLEDYTGQFCGNCPRAARMAETLRETYGSQLVILANHVTATYAQPQPAPDTLYQTDYRNDASTDWDNTLLISKTPGLPGGAINRTLPFAVAVNNWQTRIETVIHAPQSAKLVITTFYDSTLFLLKVKVKTTFLQAFTSPVNLVIAITQDSLVGIQKDYLPPTGTYQVDGDATPGYKFNNMVLGSANGSLGQLVKSSPIVNDTATIAAPCFLVKRCFYDLPSGICKSQVNDKYVNVVAFLYNTSTQEVLQVEKLRIR